MTITRPIAQRIAERATNALGKPVSVTDARGLLLASTAHETRNTSLASTQAAISSMTLAREVGASGVTVGLPLVYNDVPVGALMLHKVETVILRWAALSKR